MDDLISRSELLKSYDIAKMVEYDETGCGVTRIAIPVDTIKNAPAVDAVPVVRCKDCERWKRWKGGLCELLCATTEENGFCYWGERKEDA